MLHKLFKILIVLFVSVFFAFGQSASNSVEMGGIKMTVRQAIQAFYTDKICKEDAWVYACQVEIENKQKGVLSISPYNFEFKNITSGTIYEPGSSEVECQLFSQENGVLNMLNGTVDYGERLQGWVPFHISYMSRQIQVEDLEVRLKIKSGLKAFVLKWRFADYLAAKEKQAAMEREIELKKKMEEEKQAAKEKEIERGKKWKELSDNFEQCSSNFERYKNTGNLDSALEESFSIAHIFLEMASKFVMDSTTKYGATYQAAMKFCAVSANKYYQEGKNADFERIYLRVLDDNLPVRNDMENDVVAYGKRLLTQNEEGFVGFYQKVEQKTTPPAGLKQWALFTYEKRGDECRSRNDLKGAIEYYTFAQKAGGKVGLKMAKVFYQNGEIEKAIDNFDTVIASPDYNEDTKAEAKQQLSIIYTEQAKTSFQTFQSRKAELSSADISMHSTGFSFAGQLLEKAIEFSKKALFYDGNNKEAQDLKIKYEKKYRSWYGISSEPHKKSFWDYLTK